MSNVTTIKSEPTLPAHLEQAVREQQRRVLHVVGMLQCLLVAANTDEAPEFDAALEGLQELAQNVYDGLDSVALAKRAQVLADERAEKEARP